MVKQFNRIQQAYLTIIEEMNFNNFDGPRIVEDLRANPGLWERVIPGHITGIENFRQRELLEGYPYIDSLYILPVSQADGSISPDIKKALSSLISKWGADEIKLLKARPAIGPEREYFLIWFD